MNLLSLAFQGSWEFKLRLFKNNLEVEPATVLGDFTEANYSGYAEIPLDDMPDPEVSPGGKARIQAGDFSFLHDGGPTPNDVYGYYIVATNGVEEKLCWGDRMEGAPFTMAALDDEVPVTVVITDTQEI